MCIRNDLDRDGSHCCCLDVLALPWEPHSFTGMHSLLFLGDTRSAAIIASGSQH